MKLGQSYNNKIAYSWLDDQFCYSILYWKLGDFPSILNLDSVIKLTHLLKAKDTGI